ncbi:myo-inositol 2-dehydrogenase/D-chiro-inositol 1-dehydrogenase [Pseudomonas sp. SORGH_AS 211]|uniref:Gfo/Idh/MocA family oxidoreductase n=1 Tax=Pseudomonas sp. SORGH_AS_0211 TaxID=3041796 RepID=UPI0028566140|nr:Gfo/Idh/MocA family oxidoreductase [Pseudomonas sp. SORGH_AS_0211]MDR6178842.1 myo-inositol 2-dehydrogenase/D-chiro-inositol 1-dehydrogenase [Pseudomonas sp. SORGH_AS_0211]
MPQTKTPLSLGLIGTGRMGTFHATALARHLHGARLVALADPAPGAAARLGETLDVAHIHTDPQALIDNPAVEAVVIVAPARSHAELVVAAARAGKPVFCEKPMAVTLEEADRAIAACAEAGVALQVGFNRRFATSFRTAHELISQGRIGTPQLLRSLTRDPALHDPAAVKPWTIFLETLIHDFDTLNFFNPGARAVQVYAVADALVRPDFRDRGLLDTAVVTLRYDNGAIATAEANFQAVYGYDVRGEVFGSAGMLTAGDARTSELVCYGAEGISQTTQRSDAELLRDAYLAELRAFVDAVREGTPVPVGGNDARAALAIALAAIESVQTGQPVAVAE